MNCSSGNTVCNEQLIGLPDKHDVLRRYFGYTSFRFAQEQLIDKILSGRDCIGVMPTGAGKSICFQVPALMLDGTTIVVSPLISLMKDQAEALRENGISAVCINSSMSEMECADVFKAAYDGCIKILYVAPERLETKRFRNLVSNLRVPLVAIDEAHCVSQWGQDFRQSYLKIADFVAQLAVRPVVAAFTATATSRVKQDISELLQLKNPFEVTTGFDRPNLFFDVRRPISKLEELIKILSEPLDGSAIVYCATRKNVSAVCALLCHNGFRAGEYHAGLSSEVRTRMQEDFIYDRLDIMVATNAFGMGIDKSNVRLVVHYNCPKDMESYYQEAGRAGRDGGESRCIMLYDKADIEISRFLIERSGDDLPPDEQQKLQKIQYQRLDKICSYGNLHTCLRSYILEYFGEKPNGDCGWCSNCLNGYQAVNITIEAQKILSCIYRLKQCGKASAFAEVCDILLGECDDEYKSLSTYGIMKGEDRNRLEEIGKYLVEERFFEECGTNKICVLTPKSDEFMRLRKPVRMKVRKRVREAASDYGDNPELFEQLRTLRKKQAALLGVPPYVVFNDETLRSMCRIMPTTLSEFLMVQGVATIKAQRYWKKFTAAIREYLNTH